MRCLPLALVPVVVLLAGCEEGGAWLAVYNDSDFTLTGLVVEDLEVDSLAPHAVAGPQNVGLFFAVPYIEFSIDGLPFRHFANDHLGDSPTAEGRWGFDLHIETLDPDPYAMESLGQFTWELVALDRRGGGA